MSADNPDTDNPDSDETVIRPMPGGRTDTARTRPSARPPVAMDYSAMRDEVTRTGVNPIVAAAQPLLSLCTRLRDTTTQTSIESLRDRVVAEIGLFEDRLNALRVSRENIQSARYALCATVDDIVLNTPWGSDSIWGRHSMVVAFYGEAYGGRRFFDLLDRLERDPGNAIDVLELMYLCLSLGFEGEIRLDPRRTGEHGRIREGVFRIIRDRRGQFERALSAAWQGVTAPHRPLSSYVPTWVIAIAAAGALTAIFTGFSFALNSSSDRVNIALAGVLSQRAVAPPRTAPPPTQAAISDSGIETLLKPEIQQGLVEVAEDGRFIAIRLRSPGLFQSGSAAIEDKYASVIDRIGQALETRPGKVVVTGHTDNVPIRSIRFPSNWHLSVARADEVRKIMIRRLSDPQRASAEGRGESEPIASNSDASGRERNRRIEIMLTKAGVGLGRNL